MLSNVSNLWTHYSIGINESSSADGYGGLKVTHARKLKDLEKENGRLKKLVADLSLDNAMLREVASGNF